MKQITIDLKKGKKKPNRVTISNNQIILIGNPPYTCLDRDFPFLKDLFDVTESKDLKETESETQTAPTATKKGGRNG